MTLNDAIRSLVRYYKESTNRMAFSGYRAEASSMLVRSIDQNVRGLRWRLCHGLALLSWMDFFSQVSERDSMTQEGKRKSENGPAMGPAVPTNLRGKLHLRVSRSSFGWIRIIKLTSHYQPVLLFPKPRLSDTDDDLALNFRRRSRFSEFRTAIVNPQFSLNLPVALVAIVQVSLIGNSQCAWSAQSLTFEVTRHCQPSGHALPTGH
jgi:hypothetical protein